MRKGKAQTSHAKANTQAKNYPSIYLSIKLCIAPQKKATQIERSLCIRSIALYQPLLRAWM